MQIDLEYFWKIFTSIVASFGIIMTAWGLIKQFKKNTSEAKQEMILKEKRAEALNKIAENIEIFEDYTRSSQEQKELVEKTELMQEGMLAMLRFRINRLCIVIKEQGFMTIDEKLDLEDLYSAYEKLGGNSRTHELYEYTIKNYKVHNY